MREWELTRTNLRKSRTPIVMAINGSDNFKVNERVFVREISKEFDQAVEGMREALKTVMANNNGFGTHEIHEAASEALAAYEIAKGGG